MIAPKPNQTRSICVGCLHEFDRGNVAKYVGPKKATAGFCLSCRIKAAELRPAGFELQFVESPTVFVAGDEALSSETLANLTLLAAPNFWLDA